MPALIELKDVNKSYREGTGQFQALRDINLNIAAGEFVAIVGPSGSGKSTLANIIAGLDKVDSGSVSVNQTDLAKLRDRQLSQHRNKQIGFVFQSFNLQPTYTVLENAMLPLMLSGVSFRKRREVAAKCLSDVGLGDKTKRL